MGPVLLLVFCIRNLWDQFQSKVQYRGLCLIKLYTNCIIDAYYATAIMRIVLGFSLEWFFSLWCVGDGALEQLKKNYNQQSSFLLP